MLKKIYTTAIALTFLFCLKIIIQHSLENSFITSGVSSLYKFSVVAICVKYGHLSGLKLNISATCAVVTVSSVNDSYLVSSQTSTCRAHNTGLIRADISVSQRYKQKPNMAMPSNHLATQLTDSHGKSPRIFCPKNRLSWPDKNPGRLVLLPRTKEHIMSHLLLHQPICQPISSSVLDLCFVGQYHTCSNAGQLWKEFLVHRKEPIGTNPELGIGPFPRCILDQPGTPESIQELQPFQYIQRYHDHH